MGCKGSKHALHLHGGCGAAAPEPRRGSRRRHSVVALRSAALGTLSLDRAAAAVAAASAGLSFDAGGGGRGDGCEGMMIVMDKKKARDDGAEKLLGPSRSFGGWRPATPPLVPQRRATVAPRTPSKTPVREAPEEINVWELMKGLDDDEESDDDDSKKGSRERTTRSEPGSPVFDPELLDEFRKAIDELAPGDDSPLSDSVKRDGGGEVARREIPTFPGIVRARVDVFQERINAKTKRRLATPPAPPPDSAGRVVVYLTSLRGVRRTYEDCCSTAAVLRAYGALVDERDLSMHAGFKDELRAALGTGGGGRIAPLPQVFADGRHLGGAEEVRRLHEAGELAAALEACCCGGAGATAKGDAPDAAGCAGCGGVRFVPCGACSGSCKVFVEDEDGGAGGAFRRCPECNENGLVRCPVC